MDKTDKYFNEYKKIDKNLKTGEDFLLLVHKRIVRKKKRRRNTFLVLCISFLTTLLYFIVPNSNSTNDRYLAGVRQMNEIYTGLRSREKGSFKKVVNVKEEVPLLENLSFSTYDENVEYGVEKINYIEGNSI